MHGTDAASLAHLRAALPRRFNLDFMLLGKIINAVPASNDPTAPATASTCARHRRHWNGGTADAFASLDASAPPELHGWSSSFSWVSGEHAAAFRFRCAVVCCQAAPTKLYVRPIPVATTNICDMSTINRYHKLQIGLKKDGVLRTPGLSPMETIFIIGTAHLSCKRGARVAGCLINIPRLKNCAVRRQSYTSRTPKSNTAVGTIRAFLARK